MTLNANQSLLTGALAVIGASACCALPLVLLEARIANITCDNAITNTDQLIQATTNAGYPSTLTGTLTGAAK